MARVKGFLSAITARRARIVRQHGENRHVGRFIKKYTQPQIDAVLHSVVVEGRKVTDTIAMARAGELAGLEPFDFNLGYAYDMCRKRRGDVEQANPEALRSAIEHEIGQVAALALAQSRELRRKGSPDPDELKRWILTLRAAQNGLAPVKAAKAQGRPHDRETRVADGDDVLAGLLKNAKGPRNGGPSNGNDAG